MILKIGLTLLGVLVVFLIYVSTRDGHFRVERSGVLKATPEKIFPYISQFKLGKEWIPFDQTDPNVKRTFKGIDGSPGAVMEFDGNSKAGSGSLEMLSLEQNKSATIKLIMTKPMKAENTIEYKLEPVSDGTKFTWTMSGDSGFIGKIFNVFVDCDKMIGGEFEKGIANLITKVEGN